MERRDINAAKYKGMNFISSFIQFHTSVVLPEVESAHDGDGNEEGDHGTQHVHRDVVLDELDHALGLGQAAALRRSCLILEE